jgi:hypothetical protein
MNERKIASSIDGKRFLQDSLIIEQEVLAKQLQLSSSSITHSATTGEVNENHFIHLLRRYLPKRYGVDNGFVIDCKGKTSQQIDIIIYDPQYTPRLLDQQDHHYVLAEAVYSVLEVKPIIDKRNLEYAAQKAESVRLLHRTSVPIPHAGGCYPSKPLFPILGGIVSRKAKWSDGLLSARFSDMIKEQDGNQTLSFGVALEDRAFNQNYDVFDLSFVHKGLTISDPQGCLAWFIFTLLKRLQELGTVPAVDWEAYRAILS